jgi:hypothetical protein
VAPDAEASASVKYAHTGRLKFRRMTRAISGPVVGKGSPSSAEIANPSSASTTHARATSTV